MKMILSQKHSQVMELLTVEELEKRILNVNFFHVSNHLGESIDNFLKFALYSLNHPNQTRCELLKKYYITSLLTYEFLPHLLSIDLYHLRNNFVERVSKQPYNIENPFDVYFVYEDKNISSKEYKTSPILKSINELSESSLDLGIKKKLKHFDEIKKQLIKQAVNIHKTISQVYTRELHAGFLMYSRVLPKLIGVVDSEQLLNLRQEYKKIVARYGDCELQFPHFFVNDCRK